MKKFLICALLAFALALNTQARDKEKHRDKYKEKDKQKYTDRVESFPSGSAASVPKNYNGPVVSASDSGNTALLLGTAVLVLALASRRFAIR
jgi:hypothetical protein